MKNILWHFVHFLPVALLFILSYQAFTSGAELAITVGLLCFLAGCRAVERYLQELETRDIARLAALRKKQHTP